MRKRIAVIVLLISVLATSLFAFAGCQKADYVIGIMENSEHFASDMVQKGFRDTLDSLMVEAGKTYKLKYRKSEGDSTEKIAESEKSNVEYLKKKGVNIIFAMSQSSADSAVENAVGVPTVFAQAAIGDRNLQESELRIQVEKQIELMLMIAPEPKKLGIVYCASTDADNKTKAEINMEMQVKLAKEIITEKLGADGFIENGYEKQEDKTHDGHVREILVDMKNSGVGCVFIPVDNTLASVAIGPKLHERGNTNIYTNKNGIAAREVANMPIVCGDVNMNEFCGVATYSVDYYSMGAEAAREVYEILVKGKESSYSVFKTDFSKGKYIINQKVIDDLKNENKDFDIPQSVKDLATID